MIERRTFLTGAMALAALPALGQSTSGQSASGPWLVELFTSQGCSSCPPADKLLGDICRRPDLVALSFHVDYWDHIGWKDPFASHETTQRQHLYAASLKQSYVYTPEMVVDGMVHGPGLAAAAFDAMLEEAKRRAGARAVPTIARDGDGLSVSLAAHPLTGGPADILAAIYDRRHSTTVTRGENGGHVLENVNVVRRLQPIARWDGSPARWRLPGEPPGAEQGVAVLVQSANCGPVLGCAKFEATAAG